MKHVICTMVKNEQPYIDEWIQYHLNLGFDHIYIFEDYDSDPLQLNYDKVSVTTIPSLGIPNYKSQRTQQQLFKWCMENIKDEWILFNDVDEFLILENGITLDELTSEYEDYSGIWLDWKLFDSNGLIVTPDKGVMESYTRPLDDSILLNNDIKWNKKSFVNMKKAKTWEYPVHIIEGGCNVEFNTDYLAPKCFKKAWLNHYFSKSWEEFVERMFKRGNMNNYSRTCDDFFKTNPDLLPFKEILIESVRYRNSENLMYISKDLRIIAGGNVNIINKLKQK